MRDLNKKLILKILFILVLIGVGFIMYKKDKKMPGTQPIIPRNVLFGNPDKASVKLSPNGKYITFLAPLNGVLNVFIAPSDDITSAIPITHDTHRGIRKYGWLYDNNHIAYMQDLKGDENWHIHLVNIATKTDRDITPYEGALSHISAISHDHPNEFIIATNKRDKSYFDLFKYNIIDDSTTLVYENTAEFGDLILDENYNLRFAAKPTKEGGTDIYSVNDSFETEIFLNISPEDYYTTSILGFNKAMDSIYMLDSRNRNTSALMSFNLNTKESTLIYENAKADIDGIFSHPTEHTILSVSYNYTKPENIVIDKSIQKDIEYLESLEKGALNITSASLDNSKWVVAYLYDNKPISYYLYDRKTKTSKFLFTNRKDLEQYVLAPMHPLVIKSRDGLDLVSYLTLPVSSINNEGDAKPIKPVPLIVDVHGGPKARDSWGLNLEHQWFADRGYAVLNVNYRGSTGLGKDFTNKGDGEWGAKMHDDLLDAVQWAIDNGITTKDQVAIYGGSYGGYATLVGLTFTPDVFKCGINIVGVSNLKTLLESIPDYWKPFYNAFTKQIGGNLETPEGLEFLKTRSPITHVDKITKPLLIAHGANDPRVKRAESDQIVESMKSKKIPVTYLLYPDEGHGFARPENRMSFYAIAEKFLAQYLGGRFEEAGDDLKNSSVQIEAGEELIKTN